MNEIRYEKCFKKNCWDICRFVEYFSEDDLRYEDDEQIIKEMEKCYNHGDMIQCYDQCTKFLQRLSYLENDKFQRVLMQFARNCTNYNYAVAQIAEQLVKDSFIDAIFDKNLLELANTNLFRGSWKRMQEIAVAILIEKNSIDILEEIAQIELNPVWGQWTDTWDSEHSGITHYMGLHPKTQKMAQEYLSEFKNKL
jgi:hypothetical protein